MATFTWVPDFGSPASYAPRVKQAKFGDGYIQRAADGINVNPASFSLTFTGRSDGERAAVVAFLDARGGVESFDWTPPGAVSASKWICGKYGYTPVAYDVNTINATFEQVYE